MEIMWQHQKRPGHLSVDKDVMVNRRRLAENQRWLEGNHVDLWVASDFRKKIARGTAVVKMRKTGDVKTYGLHHTKDTKFPVGLQ